MDPEHRSAAPEVRMRHPFRLPEVPEPLRHAPSPFHVEPPLVFVPPKWEYRHLVRKAADEPPIGEEELNALGAEGWELVAVFAGPGSVHFYFKRLIR